MDKVSGVIIIGLITIVMAGIVLITNKIEKKHHDPQWIWEGLSYETNRLQGQQHHLRRGPERIQPIARIPRKQPSRQSSFLLAYEYVGATEMFAHRQDIRNYGNI